MPGGDSFGTCATVAVVIQMHDIVVVRKLNGLCFMIALEDYWTSPCGVFDVPVYKVLTGPAAGV